ncbi:MAG TPA: hypothetical protein VFU74_00595 [Actinocrinis sp.]|nr:hypothetical protein [Actinocrinis sp.]
MRISTVTLAASGWLALASTTLPALSVLRVLLSLVFVLFCPGTAILKIAAATTPALTAGYEPLLRAALAIAASLSVATLASEAFFLTGSFTMQRCVTALAALTTMLALAPVLVRACRTDATSRP